MLLFTTTASMILVALCPISSGFIWPSTWSRIPFRLKSSATTKSARLSITANSNRIRYSNNNLAAFIHSQSSDEEPPLDDDDESGQAGQQGVHHISNTNNATSIQPANTTTVPPPSIPEILQFAIPAIGVWLCSPLLSLVDTAAVGLLAGTVPQAALNPATAVTDYSARCMSFLYTGTTNLVASSSSSSSSSSTASATKYADPNQTSGTIISRRVVGALRLSLAVGAGLGLALWIGARPLLQILIGTSSHTAGADDDAAIFQAAVRYVRIRALGMPAQAALGTAQAACLGLRDARSPLRIIAIAAAANLVLDVLLVGQRRWPSCGGTAGAAVATVAAQYAAVFLFGRYLGRQKVPPQQQRQQKQQPTREEETRLRSVDTSIPSTRGMLAGQFTVRNFLLRRPSPETASVFAPFVVPVTTTQVGRCSTYIAMGHVVSSSLGAVSMAANQIITSIFYTLIPIADSLSLTAQSLLPSLLLQQGDKKQTARAVQTTTLNLLKVAGMVGLCLAAIVACIPLGCHWFTTDPAVLALVQRIVPVLFVIFSLHGVFCGAEGILLARKDLSFLGRMYALYFVVVPYLMLRIKAAARAGAAVDLGHVWNLFLAYQLVRISVWVGRVAWLQRRMNRNQTPSSSTEPN